MLGAGHYRRLNEPQGVIRGIEAGSVLKGSPAFTLLNQPKFCIAALANKNGLDVSGPFKFGHTNALFFIETRHVITR